MIVYEIRSKHVQISISTVPIDGQAPVDAMGFAGEVGTKLAPRV